MIFVPPWNPKRRTGAHGMSGSPLKRRLASNTFSRVSLPRTKPCLRLEGLRRWPPKTQILALAQAALAKDTGRVLGLVRQIQASAGAGSALSKRLERAVARAMDPDPGLAGWNDKTRACVWVQTAARALDSVILPPEIRAQITELVTEVRAADRLAAYGLAPRHRLLLTGVPGTGKTSLAEALAHALGVPFLTLHYGQIITSLLGETGTMLTRVLDRASGTSVVLLIDEMETLLSERAGTAHHTDVGEQARVVATFLLALDRVAPPTVVVGATNHPDMLDRAVRRRFDLVLDLPDIAGQSQQAVWVDALIARLARDYPLIPLAHLTRDLPRSGWPSLAALEEIRHAHLFWPCHLTEASQAHCLGHGCAIRPVCGPYSPLAFFGKLL